MRKSSAAVRKTSSPAISENPRVGGGLPPPIANAAGATRAKQLAVFNFDNHPVHTIEREGEVWFVLSDVTNALGFSRSRDAARMLDADEKGAHIVRTPGGPQEVTIINESGLYSLTLTSRKPEAKRFKRWVTHEVLPTIRKTGRYETTPALPSFQRLMMTLENGQMTNIKAIPEASCVIDPNNPLNVATFIREFVPSSQYPELFTLLAEHLTKYRPAAGLPNEINEAINRKAAEKALEGFVCIREKMERHAKFRLETPRLSKESVLAQIEAFEGLEGELVLVNASDLRSLTASLASMGVVAKHAENAAHAIERMTGREWYGRGSRE